MKIHKTPVDYSIDDMVIRPRVFHEASSKHSLLRNTENSSAGKPRDYHEDSLPTTQEANSVISPIAEPFRQYPAVPTTNTVLPQYVVTLLGAAAFLPVLAATYFMSYCLRFGGQLGDAAWRTFFTTLLWVVPVKLV